jgi:cytochrome c-type biogenesis protein CcmE
MQTALDTPEQQEQSRPRRKRRRLPITLIVGGIAILGAVIYLIVANTQADAEYYMTVSELKICKSCTTQSVRVAGTVQQQGIVYDNAHNMVRFVINDGTQSLPVVYSGVVPDIFRPGITVVVEGHYTGQGPFQAQTLLTKCPSKFQVATPGTQ